MIPLDQYFQNNNTYEVICVSSPCCDITVLPHPPPQEANKLYDR